MKTRWNTQAGGFWMVVALQALFLLGWAGWHEWVRSHAPVLLLKTRPVDPQDLLRGDYMILGYEIGQVALPEGIEEGGEAWVVLEPREGYHAAVKASLAKPELAPGQVVVRGRRQGQGLEFGIESFYVPEGKGSPRFEKIEVEAALSSTHNLYIKRVLLDGKPYP